MTSYDCFACGHHSVTVTESCVHASTCAQVGKSEVTRPVYCPACDGPIDLRAGRACPACGLHFPQRTVLPY